MPYIVTTTQDADENNLPPDEAPIRRAVATLDEARDYAESIYHERRGTDADDAEAGIGPDDPIRGVWLDYLEGIPHIPVKGGAVGPLPDGTVIEVEHAAAGSFDADGFYYIREPSGELCGPYSGPQEWADDYNAAQ